MSNEVVDLLNALHEGTMSTEEVAQRFRDRRWPRRPPIHYDSYLDRAAAELDDPAPYVPESFDDVIAAYDQQKITRDQLRILSEAIGESQRAEDAASPDR
jgi:hypothetical protein